VYLIETLLLQDLRSEGLNVSSAIVVVDREQGGNNSLSEKGVTMHSLCTLSHVRQIYVCMWSQSCVGGVVVSVLVTRPRSCRFKRS
jgi:hypothetical protein